MTDPVLHHIEELLAPFALMSRGAINRGSADLPCLSSGDHAAALILIGNAGSAFWPLFRQSAESSDGLDHPLDRWSKRIGDEVARQVGGTSIYPFDGPPYHPFLSWAKTADVTQSSKIGMLIHPEYGLSHAYRFALLLPSELRELPGLRHSANICDACLLEPCLRSCPVNAFSAAGYDVEACYSYLEGNPESACHQSGCVARNSCPVGASFRYNEEHTRFHMAAFYKARQRRILDNS